MLERLFNSALEAIALASSDGNFFMKLFFLCLFFEQLLTDHSLICQQGCPSLNCGTNSLSKPPRSDLRMSLKCCAAPCGVASPSVKLTSAVLFRAPPPPKLLNNHLHFHRNNKNKNKSKNENKLQRRFPGLHLQQPPTPPPKQPACVSSLFLPFKTLHWASTELVWTASNCRSHNAKP